MLVQAARLVPSLYHAIAASIIVFEITHLIYILFLHNFL